MKKIIYFLFVCVGAFYACKDEEQVLLNADFILLLSAKTF